MEPRNDLELKLKSIVQVIASISLALLSVIISILVNRHLSVSDRTIYGIYMVTLGQLFLLAQFGLPGAFTIAGLKPLKFGKLQDILLLVVKRFLPFAMVTVILMKIYNLSLQFTFLILIGYLILVPAQWILSAFQPHISNLEFAVWRILPTSVQLLFVLLGYISSQSLNLRILILSWLSANLAILVLASIRSKRIAVKYTSDNAQNMLETMSALGRRGFIAHIGISDIIRLEIFLVPLVYSANYSARYFAVAGLANWSRVLVDGLSISIFQRYTQLSFQAARKIALRRVIVTALFGISMLIAISPISTQIFIFAVGPSYESVYTLFISLSGALMFSSLRRMYLDAFRTHGNSNTSFASKIETLSWAISILPISLLILGIDFDTWASFTCFSNFFALCFLIYRGQRWNSVE